MEVSVMDMILDIIKTFVGFVVVGGFVAVFCPPLGYFIIGFGLVAAIVIAFTTSTLLAAATPVFIIAALALAAYFIFKAWKKEEKYQISIPKVLVKGLGIAVFLFLIVNFVNIGLDRALNPIEFNGPARVLETYTVYCNGIPDIQLIIMWLATGIIASVLYTLAMKTAADSSYKAAVKRKQEEEYKESVKSSEL